MASLGLTKNLFGLEHLHGEGKCIIYSIEEKMLRVEIGILMQMDAPESLDSFRDFLKNHFTKYPRYVSRIVKVGDERFLKRVTDESKLASQFRVIDKPMDL